MTIQERTKPQLAIMNAVHDLPVLVARDEGFFKDEGLDIEFVTTPGMAQVTTSHSVKFDSVFDRPLDSVYNDGGIDQYRMCEWGIMKRAVEADGGTAPAEDRGAGRLDVEVRDRRRPRLQDLRARDAEGQGDRGDAEQRLALHHAEDDGRLPHAGARQDHQRRDRCPSASRRCKQGKVAAVSLMEPWISVAQKMGLRILIESHSTRSEAAGDDLDGKTLAAMFRAQARAVKVLEKDPHALPPLLHPRDRRAARAPRVPDLAPASRRAAALHARAVRRHLQLDGQVEHGRARRHLREHRRQPRLAVGAQAHRLRASDFGRQGVQLRQVFPKPEAPRPKPDKSFTRSKARRHGDHPLSTPQLALYSFMPHKSWLFIKDGRSIWIERPHRHSITVAGPGSTSERHHFLDEEAVEAFEVSIGERLTEAGWFLWGFDRERRHLPDRRGVVRDFPDRRRPVVQPVDVA